MIQIQYMSLHLYTAERCQQKSRQHIDERKHWYFVRLQINGVNFIKKINWR